MTVYVSVKINHAMGNLQKGDIVQGVLKKHGVVINDGVVPNRLVDEQHIDEITVTSGKTGLRPLRIAKRVSARELGDFIGKSPSAVYSYENGLHGVPDKQRSLICEYLNTDPRYIDFDAVKKAHDLKSEVDKLTEDERNEFVEMINRTITDVEQANELAHNALSHISKLARYVEMVEYDLAREKEYRRSTMEAVFKWNTRSLWQRIKDYINGVKFDIELSGVSLVNRDHIDKQYREFQETISKGEEQ